MSDGTCENKTLILRILPEGKSFIVDDELEQAIYKSVPYDPQYDQLAIVLRERNGTDTRNLLKTRRQQLRTRHRRKKDRLGEWERLDDLYFCACTLLHDEFPDFPLFGDFVELFNPKGIAKLTMDVVYRIIRKHIEDCELEVKNYNMRVLAGQKEGVRLKIDEDSQGHLLDLRGLYAIARNLTSQKKYKGLAQALVDLAEPTISAAVISKNIIYQPNNLLGRDSLDELWEIRDLRIMRKLSDLPRFAYGLTDAQAMDVMQINDYNINDNLKRKLDLLSHAKTRPSGRISNAFFERLSKFLEECV